MSDKSESVCSFCEDKKSYYHGHRAYCAECEDEDLADLSKKLQAAEEKIKKLENRLNDIQGGYK